MRGLWIGVGGFFGALCRYWLDGVVSRAISTSFPWGTLAVNVSGCFVVGALTTMMTDRFLPHPTVRLALTIGFLGAYTTFSTFAYETVRLAQDGAVGVAAINVAASILTGLAACWAGIVLGRAL